jgi:hypothetical protein
MVWSSRVLLSQLCCGLKGTADEWIKPQKLANTKDAFQTSLSRIVVNIVNMVVNIVVNIS